MKLLVTGVTGFVGSHLARRLSNEGHIVHALTRASSRAETVPNVIPHVLTENIQDLIEFMRTEKFDGVIHLASLFLARHEPDDVKRLVESNVLFSTTILEASVQSNIPWFVNTGTFWQHYDNSTYSPANLYAATKQAFEDIATYYVQSSSINFVTLKLSDTFGPGDTRPKLLNLWMKAARSGEPLDMSPGEQLLDISYIDNVVDAFVQLMNLLREPGAEQYRGRCFAVSSGKPQSIRQLAKLFEDATGLTLNIRWGNLQYRPREIMVPWNKGDRVPDWAPAVSFYEGVKKTFGT